ncbi:hypothetical protein [Nocardia australiensis]|nr:hypothetical protein [Nocardia australiensis]
MSKYFGPVDKVLTELGGYRGAGTGQSDGPVTTASGAAGPRT